VWGGVGVGVEGGGQKGGGQGGGRGGGRGVGGGWAEQQIVCLSQCACLGAGGGSRLFCN
jgi:hypothetical protein